MERDSVLLDGLNGSSRDGQLYPNFCNMALIATSEYSERKSMGVYYDDQ
jgi:hypothetical protein